MQEAEQGIEEINASEEVGKISGDGIRSSRNMSEESEKLMVNVTRYYLCQCLFRLKHG